MFPLHAAPSTGREQGRPLRAFLPKTGARERDLPGKEGKVGKPAPEGEAGRAMGMHTDTQRVTFAPHIPTVVHRDALRGRGRAWSEGSPPHRPPRLTPSSPNVARSR